MMPTHNLQGKHHHPYIHMIAAALAADTITFYRASDLDHTKTIQFA
jgi:hypothetical protein